MRRHIWLILAPVLLIAADDAKKEYERFEGTWKIVAMEADGMKLPEDTFKHSRLILKGDNFTFAEGNVSYKGSYKVDTGKKPKTIDITFTDGPEKGNTIGGIYELEGDVYKVCLPQSGKKRPTEFTTKAGSGNIFEILHREKK
jgi:uncharacterized protein (TIGR03067 family)